MFVLVGKFLKKLEHLGPGQSCTERVCLIFLFKMNVFGHMFD